VCTGGDVGGDLDKERENLNEENVFIVHGVISRASTRQRRVGGSRRKMRATRNIPTVVTHTAKYYGVTAAAAYSHTRARNVKTCYFSWKNRRLVSAKHFVAITHTGSTNLCIQRRTGRRAFKAAARRRGNKNTLRTTSLEKLLRYVCINTGQVARRQATDATRACRYTHQYYNTT